jgi:hypothetical protein
MSDDARDVLLRAPRDGWLGTPNYGDGHGARRRVHRDGYQNALLSQHRLQRAKGTNDENTTQQRRNKRTAGPGAGGYPFFSLVKRKKKQHVLTSDVIRPRGVVA